MPRRSETFKAVALAAVRSGMAVQEVADSIGLARSALYAWVAQERAARDRPAEELMDNELAVVAGEVSILTGETDLLQVHVDKVGELVAVLSALAPIAKDSEARS